nr:hypothetical protein [Pseudopedobacter sp.]
MAALHQKNNLGYSLFELFTEFSKIKSADNKVYFPTGSFADFDREQLRGWKDLVADISASSKMIGRAHQHPLTAMVPPQYSPSIKQEAITLLNDLSKCLTAHVDLTNKAKALLKVEALLNTQERHHALHQVAQLLMEQPDFPVSMLETDAFDQSHAQLIGLTAHGLKRDQLRDDLLKEFSKEILKFPADQTLLQWNIAADKWFLPKWLKQNALLKPLKKLALSGSLDKNSVNQVLQQVINHQQEQEFIDKATFAPSILGFLWKNGEPEWNLIARLSESLIQLNKTATLIYKDEKPGV